METCILFRLLLVTYPRKHVSMQAIKSTHTLQKPSFPVFQSADNGYGSPNEVFEAIKNSGRSQLAHRVV